MSCGAGTGPVYLARAKSDCTILCVFGAWETLPNLTFDQMRGGAVSESALHPASVAR